jgi:polysaccharide biosynthesis transport protein
VASRGDTTYDYAPVTRENRSLLAVLKRRAWIIVVVTLLCGAATLGIAYARGDTYESTAKLLFQQTISPEINAIGLLPTSLDADNLAQNNVEVAGSRSVAIATSQELRRRGVEKSVDDIVPDVAVSETTQSDVVNIVASADSARGAALLATVYASEAVRFVERRQREQALGALRSIREQLAAMPRRDRNGIEGRRLRSDAEKIRTIADVGPGNPQVIQQGFVPDGKSENLVQTTLLGLLFGVVLGVGIALLREQADRRLRRAEDVSAAFDAPVLTTVPRHRKLKRNAPFGELPPEVAEAFRMLQINLRYGSSGTVRSVLVTSTQSREGKTTVAWYLASAAASVGLSVAVVEADMRRPSLAGRYEVQPEPGLAEALQGQVSVTNVLQPVSPAPADTTMNGYQRPLHAIVAGHPPLDPWALMQSPAMGRVLEDVTKDHDLTVIDAPPIPHVADAISLLRRVDGVIVVASVNSTRGPQAGRLRDQLEALDARVLGVVANGGSAGSGYAYAPAASRAGSGGERPETPADMRDQARPRWG